MLLGVWLEWVAAMLRLDSADDNKTLDAALWNLVLLTEKQYALQRGVSDFKTVTSIRCPESFMIVVAEEQLSLLHIQALRNIFSTLQQGSSLWQRCF